MNPVLVSYLKELESHYKEDGYNEIPQQIKDLFYCCSSGHITQSKHGGYCRDCGEKVRRTNAFTPYWANIMKEFGMMLCKCGYPFAELEVFCTYCGKRKLVLT